MLRLDEETTDPIGGDVVAEVLDRFNAALETAEIVVLSDYAKGVLCDAVLATVLKMTSARGVVVIADPKRSDFSCYRGATILTPNEGEAHLGTRIEARDDLGAERAGRMALDSVGAKAVLVTRAAKGVTLVSADAPTLHLRAHAKEVADVSGAGDTFVAVLAVALSGGTPVSEAAALANIAAGISVGKRGTATVTRDEIFAALLLENFVRTDRKVVPWDQAAASVAIWHANGLKVGFANGCFDLLHPGHIRLLTEARKHCERLIVALNTDASVRRLKGRNRPVQTESSRATVMASLAAVDLVVMFGEDTPLELIRALRPDVLVKGSDYTEDRVVGADLVRDWGGQLLLVDLYDNHSTTATIRELTTSALSEPAK
jgi:D-beta-D-heptose 7-phosphate kinase/D-beta-D-heptose 1-phosphate adenosyltransferase